MPRDADGVWTIAQTGLNDDINDPTQELTVHVDRHSGSVVGHGGWNEYGPMARAMAAGIPLHMGSLGWWNLVGASLVCLSVIALSLSGLVMWWLRRPARGWRLGGATAAGSRPRAVGDVGDGRDSRRAVSAGRRDPRCDCHSRLDTRASCAGSAPVAELNCSVDTRARSRH